MPFFTPWGYPRHDAPALDLSARGRWLRPQLSLFLLPQSFAAAER